MQNIDVPPYILISSVANDSTLTCGKDVTDVQLLEASTYLKREITLDHFTRS